MYIRHDTAHISLVTDISQIFGMSLVGMVDIATVIGAAVGGIGSAIIIAKVIHNSNVKLLEHHKDLLRQQRTVNSAELSLKILESWSERKNPKFTGFLDRLENSTVPENDQDMELFLDVFENIAVFWKEGTLTETHVNEFFSTNLKQIRDNPITSGYLDDLERQNSPLYASLRTLLKKNRKNGT